MLSLVVSPSLADRVERKSPAGLRDRSHVRGMDRHRPEGLTANLLVLGEKLLDGCVVAAVRGDAAVNLVEAAFAQQEHGMGAGQRHRPPVEIQVDKPAAGRNKGLAETAQPLKVRTRDRNAVALQDRQEPPVAGRTGPGRG